MGCYSWLCKKCGKSIRSSSFDGDRCKLFLVYDNKIYEEMTGKYDSYGKVFGVKEWKNDDDIIIDLDFGGEKGGIVAYHEKCFDSKNDKPQNEDGSKPDSDQGWNYTKIDEHSWKKESKSFEHIIYNSNLKEEYSNENVKKSETNPIIIKGQYKGRK